MVMTISRGPKRVDLITPTARTLKLKKKKALQSFIINLKHVSYFSLLNYD